MNERLAKLAALAEMIKEAELGRLSAAEAARRGIARDAADVRAARSGANRQAGPDAAHVSGTASRWQAWSDRRLAALTQQEAMAAANAEAQKRLASRAFGRAHALAKLTRDRGGT